VQQTKLKLLVDRVTKAIERRVAAGEIAARKETAIYEGLFYLLVGDPVLRAPLKDFCKKAKITTTLKKLCIALGDDIKVPQALHTWITKNTSLNHSLATWHVAKSDLKLVETIAEKAGLDLDDEHHLLRHYYSSLDLQWLAEVEERFEEVEVIFNNQALQDMLLGVIETYKVPKSKKIPYSEVFGLTLGMASRQKVNKKGSGTRTKWFVYIDKAVPQIRAVGKKDSVIPNMDSIEAVVETASSMFPQLEVNGDYHSHPYRTLPRLKRVRGWEASGDDNESIANLYLGLREHPQRQHRIRVSFIVAIAKGRNVSAPPTHLAGHPSVVHMSLAGCHIYLSVYRILSNGAMTEKGVTLVAAAGEYQWKPLDRAG